MMLDLWQLNEFAKQTLETRFVDTNTFWNRMVFFFFQIICIQFKLNFETAFEKKSILTKNKNYIR